MPGSSRPRLRSAVQAAKRAAPPPSSSPKGRPSSCRVRWRSVPRRSRLARPPVGRGAGLAAEASVVGGLRVTVDVGALWVRVPM